MEILWFCLGLVLLFLAAGCFGMSRRSFVPTEEKVVGLVLGLSLAFSTFFLLILMAGLIKVGAGPMIILALLFGWFEKELGDFILRKARLFCSGSKAPDD